MNCPNSDMLELAFCLQGKDAQELAQAQGMLAVSLNFRPELCQIHEF